MNYWLRTSITILITLYTSKSTAQYFQYSQYNFTKLRVNPAMMGLNNYGTASINYRNQKTGSDFAISSNFLALSMPLVNQSTGRAWSGVGISLMSDRTAGVFSTQEATLSYAANIQISRRQLLSIGFKGLYQSRRINLNGFYTGSQYIPDRGFDQGVFNGEGFSQLTNSFFTVSSGIYWQETDRYNRPVNYLGFSFFDINKPNDSFLDFPNKLSTTLVLNGGFKIYQEGDISVFPEILYTLSSANNLVNAGFRFQYDIRSVPNQIAAQLDVLAKYVPGRSGILGFQFHTDKVSIGASYDFPIFKKNVGNLGALEIALELRKLVDPKKRIKNRNSNQQKQPTAKGKPTIKSKTKALIKADSMSVIKNDSTDHALSSGLIESVETQASSGLIKHEPLLIEKIVLNFHFEYNSVDLDDETKTFLSDLATTLEANENLNLSIIGHTDNLGSSKFNQHLSLRRANAIKHFLVKRNINPARLTTDGKGLEEPIADNETDEGRAKNRRVELKIYQRND
ncbi:MAG: PorP/SprF family type IX secretion system membrane protein [Cyclobacteriaceae bacterium]|nr:PorP/SprF family type IX secretion system membrane protein [Cyclobacteriaceae bacterium]